MTIKRIEVKAQAAEAERIRLATAEAISMNATDPVMTEFFDGIIAEVPELARLQAACPATEMFEAMGIKVVDVTPAPVAFPPPRPSDNEMIAVLAEHYDVSTGIVRTWLRSCNLNEQLPVSVG